jgi:hypothetical protein
VRGGLLGVEDSRKAEQDGQKERGAGRGATQTVSAIKTQRRDRRRAAKPQPKTEFTTDYTDYTDKKEP